MSMQRFFAIILFSIIGLASADAQAGDPPVLTVYTYSSFVAECACKLNFVATEDGVVLLSRLRLEGASSPADVVLGLDTNLTAEAAATGLFAPHGMDLGALRLPFAWRDADFVPYDFGYFAFVYDSTKA